MSPACDVSQLRYDIFSISIEHLTALLPEIQLEIAYHLYCISSIKTRHNLSLISRPFAQWNRRSTARKTRITLHCVHQAADFFHTVISPASIELGSLAPCTTVIRFEFPLRDPSHWETGDDHEGTGDAEGWAAFWEGFELSFPKLIALRTLAFRFLHRGNKSALEYISARHDFLPASLTRLEMFPVASEQYGCDYGDEGDPHSDTVSANLYLLRITDNFICL